MEKKMHFNQVPSLLLASAIILFGGQFAKAKVSEDLEITRCMKEQAEAILNEDNACEGKKVALVRTNTNSICVIQSLDKLAEMDLNDLQEYEEKILLSRQKLDDFLVQHFRNVCRKELKISGEQVTLVSLSVVSESTEGTSKKLQACVEPILDTIYFNSQSCNYDRIGLILEATIDRCETRLSSAGYTVSAEDKAGATKSLKKTIEDYYLRTCAFKLEIDGNITSVTKSIDFSLPRNRSSLSEGQNQGVIN